MQTYRPAKAPAQYDAAWLDRQMLEIQRAANTGSDSLPVRVLNVAPLRPQGGWLYNADGVNWNPGSGAGVYRYDEPTRTYIPIASLTGLITGTGLTMNTARLLGRTTAGVGAIEEISIGSNLTLLAGVLSASGGSGGTTLSATADFYFDPAGNDSNDGLTALTPWLTLQHGFNTVAPYNFNNYGANFNVAAGTYVGDITAFATPNGYISIVGAGRTTTILQGRLLVPYAGATITASDVKIKTSGGMISVGQGASFGGTNMAFDLNGGSGGVMACLDGLGDLSGDIELYGVAYSGIVTAAGNSTASLTANTLTLANTPAWSDAAIRAINNSSVTVSYSALVGTATGVRFNASQLSGIWTNTGNVNYIPGNSAGTADTATGGYYS